jgi:hypothetical protein
VKLVDRSSDGVRLLRLDDRSHRYARKELDPELLAIG